ncbi:MAG: flippase [Candidatus Magasanikbacteria bacterium]|nr:flippase [Candidatus Magasanikbacteria bacterium]
MSLIKQLAHNTLSQIVGKIISTFLGLLAIGMMTRYLGTEQFGWYITAITFLQFIGILTDFGLVPVTAQMMSEPEFDKTQLFKNLLSYRFFTALVFWIIAPFVALLFPYPIEVKIAISFTTISFLCISINQTLTGLYQHRLKMHIPAIAEIVGRIVLVGGLWGLIHYQRGFLPVMIVITVSSVAYMLTMLLNAHKEIPLGFAFDKHIWKSITLKMWPIAIAIIFNVVYLKGDILLLSFFRSQTEVGIYGAAYRVIDIVAQTAMMVMGVMLPLLTYSWSRNEREDFAHRYQLSFDTMMLMALPIMAGMILLADKIMILVAGQEFAESGNALRILAIAVFGVFLGSVFGHTSVAINKQKKTLWIFISAAILTLIGYLVFIPRYGMYGAAWMTVFSELYVGILLWLAVKKYTQQKLRLNTLFKISLATMLMASIIYKFAFLHILILILIGILAYGIGLVLFRVVTKETIREILMTKKI